MRAAEQPLKNAALLFNSDESFIEVLNSEYNLSLSQWFNNSIGGLDALYQYQAAKNAVKAINMSITIRTKNHFSVFKITILIPMISLRKNGYPLKPGQI